MCERESSIRAPLDNSLVLAGSPPRHGTTSSNLISSSGESGTNHCAGAFSSPRTTHPRSDGGACVFRTNLAHAGGTRSSNPLCSSGESAANLNSIVRSFTTLSTRPRRALAAPECSSPLRQVPSACLEIPTAIDRIRPGSQVRSRLPAGGRWIRTLGPPARESSVVAPCTRRAVSLRGLVAHPTVEQHAQRGDEGERLV